MGKYIVYHTVFCFHQLHLGHAGRPELLIMTCSGEPQKHDIRICLTPSIVHYSLAFSNVNVYVVYHVIFGLLKDLATRALSLEVCSNLYTKHRRG